MLLVVTLVGPTSSYSQMYSCLAIQGKWTYYYDNSEFTLSQDSKGNISGSYTSPLCIGYTLPIAGTITSGSFTFTISNLNQCPGTFNTWTKFTGYVGQPGCNYAYGNWTNELGYSGAFGQNTAYPVNQSNIFTRAADIPTSETSVQSGSWNATNGGAPWHQTLAPNIPSGEFSGRVTYEYASGTDTDTCWFTSSIFPPFTAITTPGFGWDVTEKTFGVPTT
jgi:hypothetical protein